MKNIITFVLLVPFSIVSTADDIPLAIVNNIMIDQQYGLKAFIELDKTISPRETECHVVDRWEYVLDLSTVLGEKLYTNLLVAYTTQKPASFFGTGECFHNGVEGLRRIELVN